MKKLLIIISSALLAVLIIQSCTKENTPTTGSALKATKTDIKVGYLDTLLLTTASTTDSVQWNVSPAGFSVINTKANAARVFFTKAGSYVVTAQKTGGTAASVTIKVNNNAPITYADTVTSKSFITNSTSDTLQLVPISNDVTMSLSAYRYPSADRVAVDMMPSVFVKDHYCKNSLLQFKSSFSTEAGWNLDLINVRQAKGCAIATVGNYATAGYDVFVNRVIGFGSYPLKIRVGSVNYTGSIVVSQLNITVNWPYTSGVIFPTKVINK